MFPYTQNIDSLPVSFNIIKHFVYVLFFNHSVIKSNFRDKRIGIHFWLETFWASRVEQKGIFI